MWLELTPDTLLTALSVRERAALGTAAVADSQVDVLTDIATTVAAEWRGALRRVVILDRRPNYVPDELLVHILADYRYRAFTRLPGMANLLDELRVREWDRANHVRDHIQRVAVAPPDPANAEPADASGKPGPAIADPEQHSIMEW